MEMTLKVDLKLSTKPAPDNNHLRLVNGVIVSKAEYRELIPEFLRYARFGKIYTPGSTSYVTDLTCITHRILDVFEKNDDLYVTIDILNTLEGRKILDLMNLGFTINIVPGFVGYPKTINGKNVEIDGCVVYKISSIRSFDIEIKPTNESSNESSIL